MQLYRVLLCTVVHIVRRHLFVWVFGNYGVKTPMRATYCAHLTLLVLVHSTYITNFTVCNIQ